MPKKEPAVPVIVAVLLERAERVGLSPLGLCKIAGLHHSVMNRWRQGNSSPTLSTLQKVMDALDKYERKEQYNERRREIRKARKSEAEADSETA